MYNKKPFIKLALLSSCFITATIFISCNSEEKKEAPKTEEVAPAVTVPDSPKTTMPSTTDTTPPNAGDTLKKGGIKPVNTKPAVPTTGG